MQTNTARTPHAFVERPLQLQFPSFNKPEAPPKKGRRNPTAKFIEVRPFKSKQKKAKRFPEKPHPCYSLVRLFGNKLFVFFYFIFFYTFFWEPHEVE